MADPRDPRSSTRSLSESLDDLASGLRTHLADQKSASRSMGKSLDDLASGLNVYLRDQSAILAEFQATQKDIRRELSALATPSVDRSVTGNGVPGLAPPPSAPVPTEVARQAMQRETFHPRESTEYRDPHTTDRQRLTDVTLDPLKGNLGAQTRKGIRENALRRVTDAAARADEAAFGVNPGEFSDLQGNRMRMRDGVTMAPPQWENGQLIGGQYVDEDGNFLGAEDALEQVMSAEEEDSRIRKAARLGIGAQVAKSVQGGAPVGRALLSAAPAGLLKGAGVVGMGLTAANEAFEFAQGQYAANREMQGIYGGGNVEQFGRRLSDWWEADVLDRFTMLGSGATRQLLRGGRGMGLDGGELDEFVDTGRGLMGQGVSDQQTLQIMRTVIEAGSSLTGLEEAIKGVTNAAREAGINAGRAREVFLKNYEASSDLMFNAQGLVRNRFVGNLTEAQTAQARQYQGIDSITGAMGDERFQRLIGNRAGMSAAEVDVMRQTSPGQFAGMVESEQVKIIESYFPGITAAVNEWIDQNGGYDATYDQPDLALALARDYGFDEYLASKVLQQLQVRVGPAGALGTIGNMLSPESPGASAAAQERAAQEQLGRGFTDQDLHPGELPRNRGHAGRNKPTPLMAEYYAGQGLTEEEYIYTDRRGNESTRTREFLAAEDRLGVVEELIANEEALGLSADGTMVRVMTSDGARAVTLGEAIRNFSDQIQSGNAKIVAGADDEVINANLADVLGVPQEVFDRQRALNEQSNVNPANEMTAQAYESIAEGLPGWMAGGFERRANELRGPQGSAFQSSQGIGQDFQEWQEEQDAEKKDSEEGGSEGGTVQLTLTPEAQRLLEVMDNNGGFMDPSAGSVNVNGGG